MAIVHELSWSVSRAGTFAACKRRYYHDYYFSWRGWERSAPAGRRQAYLLKKMTRLPMLAGECLHQALQRFFTARQAGGELGSEEVIRDALGQFRDGYRCSRDGKWRERPSKLVRLAEHHYEEEAIDEASGAAAEYGKHFVKRIESAVKNFFAMPALAPAREADPSGYLALEEMGTIDLLGVRAFAIPDFAFREQSDQIRIYDWKSGKPREQDLFQLATYVLYAVAKWQATPEDVICIDAYLPQGELTVQSFQPFELEATMARIESSLGEMQAVHFDADRSEGDPEAFPMVAEENSRECSTCNYRELCGR